MRYLILIAGVLLLTGCATAEFASIETYTNEFNGSVIHRVEKNYLPRTLLQGNLQLNPAQIVSEDGSTTNSIIAQYNADDWLFIETGESLIFLIDGERHSLATTHDGISREVIYGGAIQEKVIYPVFDTKLFYRISTASVVKVRIEGDDYYTERTLSDKNKLMFSKFYNMHANK